MRLFLIPFEFVPLKVGANLRFIFVLKSRRTKSLTFAANFSSFFDSQSEAEVDPFAAVYIFDVSVSRRRRRHV